MTTEATRARQLALACEAKKHAYRQTQDGVVVSFVLHPQEVPDELATAPLGQRYQLALVALNDDDTPKEVMQHLPGSNADGRVQPPDNAQPASAPKQSARAKRSWDEMSPAQQAGVLCADKSFQKFMTFNTNYEPDEPTVAQLVRNYCGVPSRAIIATNDASSLKWDKLVSHYRAWMHEPSVVPV